MAYADLKRSFDVARGEQLSADKELNRIEKELQSVNAAYAQVDRQFLQSDAESRVSELERYRKAQVAPFEQELSDTENKLRSITTDYQSRRADVTYDKLLSKCSSKQDILEEVRNASSVLETKIKELVGQAFYEKLCKRLNSHDIEFDSDNLDRLINYFNRSEETIERFDAGDKGISDFLNYAEKTLLEDTESEKGKRISLIFSATMVVAVLFSRYYFLPIAIISLALLAVYTIARNYQVFHILVIQKAVQGNIEKIDKHLKSQIEEEVSNQLSVLDNEYNLKKDELDSEIQRLNSDIAKALMQAEETFVYDDHSMQLRKSAEIEKLDKQKSTLLVQQAQQRALFQQKTQIVESLGEKLGGMLSTLKNDYLSGVGKDVIFKPDFLFDIDEYKNKPIFFKHPKTSCLFLYDDVADVYNFVRLISLELRAKLSPFSLGIVAVDERNMGQDLIYFTADGDSAEAASSTYTLVTDDDGVKNLISRTYVELTRRQTNIRREFENIETYNLKMVELKSFTEYYEFQFVIDPSSSYISDKSVERALRVGGELGMFVHLFMSKSDFQELRDSAMGVLDAIGKVYYLESGNYFERAKDFVAENLLSLSE